MPFLVVPSDVKERIKIFEKENEAIARGELTEEGRTVFGETSRLICLSSASYTFEYLYTLYQDWCNKIFSDNKDLATYFVNQVSFDAIPSYMIEKTVIEEAKSSDETHPSFKREYCAIFTDGSDSFFSAKKMHDLTIKDTQNPSLRLSGDKDKEYVLSIDPCFSNSANSDYFAFCVLELSKENEVAIVVHTYMEAGKDLKDHIKYFYYLLKAFNIVMICVDNADGRFLDSANESAFFNEHGLKINEIEYDGELKGVEYEQMLNKLKKEYNYNNKNIAFKHVFNQVSIRRINEQMQTWINTKKIYFGSKITQHPDYDSIVASNLPPYPFKPEESNKAKFIIDMISNQDDLVYQLKKQCSLIEVRVSPTGGQVFDLPATLKRSTSKNRARKDGYTSLLLAIEAARVYYEMMKTPEIKRNTSMAMPMMMGNSTY
jgi:hypothetical protein